MWCHPGAEAVSGDDDNPVFSIVLPVGAALVLFAVTVGAIYSYRRRRGDPENGVQSSEQDNAPSGGRRETGSSPRRDSGASVASGTSDDESEYYEYYE